MTSSPRRDDVLVDSDGRPTLLFSTYLEDIVGQVSSSQSSINSLITASSLRAQLLRNDKNNVTVLHSNNNRVLSDRLFIIEAILKSLIPTIRNQDIPASSVINRIIHLSANATLQNRPTMIFLDPATASFTVTLATAKENKGREFILKRTDSSANIVSVNAKIGETVDGNPSFNILNPLVSVNVISDGSNWWVI